MFTILEVFPIVCGIDLNNNSALYMISNSSDQSCICTNQKHYIVQQKICKFKHDTIYIHMVM